MKDNNKTLVVILAALVIILTCCTIFFNKKEKENEEEEIEKFYLSEKYYNQGEFVTIDSEGLKELNKDNLIIYTYNNYCIFTTPCDEIFKVVMDKYKIDIVSVPFSELKKTDYYETVKLAPSIIIIKDGKIVTYLKADSDEDFKRYQDSEEFEKWLDKYIYLEKEAN